MSSEFIRAALGKLDEAVARRLEEWAKAHCVAHRIERSPAGVVLYAQRHDKKSNKSHKMTLRTVFQNWGVALALEGSDWLCMLSREDFAKAVGDARGSPRGAELALDCPCAPGEDEVFLHSLPPFFAERSHALLMELRQGTALACAA